MSQFILDLFFTIVFVVLLLMLSRIKDKTFENNRESYKYTISGISALLFVSILRLLKDQAIFSSVPFLSEPVYLDLAEAIGIVTGIALLIAGVSFWLPKRNRKASQMEGDLRMQEALQKITWEIFESDKVNRIFETIPQLICGSFNFSSAIVLKKISRSGQHFIADRFNVDSALESRLKDHPIENDFRLENLVSAEKDWRAILHIPLQIRGYVTGGIFFWNNQPRVLTTDERILLDKIERALTFRLNHQYTRLKQEFYEDTRRYILHMKNMIARRKDLRAIIHDFQALFKNAVGSEYLSIAILDRFEKNMRSYTTGLNNRMLLDQGSCMPVDNTQIDKVIDSRKSLLIKNITASGRVGLDSLLLSCGQKSAMAVPIINFGRVIGVMTLGSPRANHFDHRRLLVAELIASAMAPAIEMEISRGQLFERDRYLGALSSFDTKAEDISDMDTLLRTAAETIMENVRTTMVRVTVLNNDRTELSTGHLKTIRPFDRINTERISISELLTPWHRTAIRESRPILLNQEDFNSGMGKNESRLLVFDGMKTALIIPIVINGVTFGLITLGEMRNKDRFAYDSPTILFCREIAAKVAGMIKIQRLGAALMKGRAIRSAENEFPVAENRLKKSAIIPDEKKDEINFDEFRKDEIALKALNSLEKSAEEILSQIDGEESES